MAVRKTIKWCLVIVLLVGSIGGGYGYWRLSNANDELLVRVRGEIARRAPGWDVKVGSARFDWGKKIHVYDVTLTVPGETNSLIRIPELVLVVDREKLADDLEVVVHHVKLIKPTIHLVRDVRGEWNWQKLPPLPESESKPSLPELSVIEAEVRVELQQSDATKTGRLQLHNADLKLVPSAKRSYVVKASTQVGETGLLNVAGDWNVDASTWAFHGDVKQITSSGELLGLAVGASPELRKNIAKLETAIRNATPPSARPKTPTNVEALPDFGASGTLDLAFRLARKNATAEPDFEITATIRQARISNPVLPFPLSDIAGTIRWNNQRVAIEKLSGRNGPTRIVIDGDIRRVGPSTPSRFNVEITKLPLDADLRARLPAKMRATFDEIQPTGHIDIAGAVHYDGIGKWTPRGFVLTARDCTGAHRGFPYRVRGINGTVTQRENDLFDLDMRGLAGRQPATLKGYVRNPGPTSTSLLDLWVGGLPIDETLLAACQPEVRKTLKSMGLTGNVTVHYRVSKLSPNQAKPRHQIVGDISAGTVEYKEFPYRMGSLAGRVHYDSNDDTWRFPKLTARNGTTTFTGSGTLTKLKDKQYLVFHVKMKGAHFDNELRRALPKSLETVWIDTSPTGKLDFVADLRWSTGQTVDVALSDVNITDGSLNLKAFPYPLNRVNATLAYANGVMTIHKFSGRHEETLVRAKGYLKHAGDGEWRLRLEPFVVDDCIPDRQFRSALSNDLRSVVEELDPKGKISISGMIELRGTGKRRDPVTAAWDLRFLLSQNTLNVGMPLTNVHGSVTARGTFDGRDVVMTKAQGNRIDLTSAWVKGYQFTGIQGPYSIRGKRIIIGSTEALTRKAQPGPLRPILNKERLVAKAIGGTFTLDADVRLDSVVNRRKTTSYKLLLAMNKGHLKRYAQRYMRSSRDLAGDMYGRIDLFGYGSSVRNLTGRGKLLISPAALYELPVIAQIFQLINFTPPDRTAFKFALLDFRIGNSQFVFNAIDLVGDATRLRGRGTAGFDGKLNINFYSMMPRNRVPIPILREIVSTATNAWVGVEVRGTTSNPQTNVKAIPQIDETLKRFLGAFGTRPVVPYEITPRRQQPPRRMPLQRPRTGYRR